MRIHINYTIQNNNEIANGIEIHIIILDEEIPFKSYLTKNFIFFFLYSLAIL